MSKKIKESYEWMTPEFKLLDYGPNTLKIKGVALRSNIVTRNNRHYIREELRKAGRTWAKKPVTINHAPYDKNHPMYDGRKIIGHVEYSEFNDKEDAVEYIAVINRQPYVDMLRNKSTEVKGVSIEADFLNYECPRCQNKFFDNDSFVEHMFTVHFTKEFSWEPRGLVGTALSLVLSPEEPGYVNTKIELMEIYDKDLETNQLKVYETRGKGKKSLSQLLEAVTKTGKEEESMTQQLKGKAVVTPETRITPPIGKQQTKEQEEPIPVGSHYCEEHPEDPRCKEHKKTIHGEEPAKEQEEPCPEGQHRNEEGECVPNEPVAEQDEHGHYVPDITPSTTIATTELMAKIPNILKLGEPFASYADFDDCVAKNADKDNPEAYCADIKRKVEGETVKEATPSMNIYDAQATLQSKVTENQRLSIKRETQIAEAVNKTIQSTTALEKAFNKLAQSIAETNQKSREAQHTEAKLFDSEIGKLRIDIASLVTNTQKLSNALEETKAELTNKLVAETKALEEAKAELTNKIDSKTKDFETLLAMADKNNEEQKKTIDERLAEIADANQKIINLEAKLNASDEKKLAETQTIKTRVDNLEDKLKPNFKGKTAEKTTLTNEVNIRTGK